MTVRLAAIASVAILATACAHSTVTLLSDEDGGHGAVAIERKSGSETLVNQPNSRANLDGSRTVVRPVGAKGLKQSELAVLQTMPPPARSFTLYFAEGTVDLTPASMPVLEQIRSEIAARPGAEVQVTGHTDTVGSEADNDMLSRKRADEVLGLLASRGFDRSIMSAVGRGERELKAQTLDNVASEVNRRVEVIVR